MTPEERNQAHLEQQCARWKQLDKTFNTSENSPLHHDRRCVIHRAPVTIRQGANIHPIIVK